MEIQNKIKLHNGREISFVAVDDEDILNPRSLQCNKCIIQEIDEIHCCNVACSKEERKDGKNGFFKY